MKEHHMMELLPDDAEVGTGLALRGAGGRYLFFVAGSRHRCGDGERFYAGIGGHLEPGETPEACARREAREEIGAEIELLHAPVTYRIGKDGSVGTIAVADEPAPLAWFAMIHPPGSPREGETYHLIIYDARLTAPPSLLKEDEVYGVLALTERQVAAGIDRKPTIAELLAEGAELISALPELDAGTRLYPIGTARALAHLFRAIGFV